MSFFRAEIFKLLIVPAVLVFASTASAQDCSKAKAVKIAKEWMTKEFTDMSAARIDRLANKTFYNSDQYKSWITTILDNGSTLHFLKVGCDGKVEEVYIGD